MFFLDIQCCLGRRIGHERFSEHLHVPWRNKLWIFCRFITFFNFLHIIFCSHDFWGLSVLIDSIVICWIYFHTVYTKQNQIPHLLICNYRIWFSLNQALINEVHFTVSTNKIHFTKQHNKLLSVYIRGHILKQVFHSVS